MKNDHLWSFFNIIYTFLGSILEPCYIQNHVIMNRVIKRLKCTAKLVFAFGSKLFPYKVDTYSEGVGRGHHKVTSLDKMAENMSGALKKNDLEL